MSVLPLLPELAGLVECPVCAVAGLVECAVAGRSAQCVQWLV